MEYIFLLKDCCNNDCKYGFIKIQDVTPEEVQEMINSIKNDDEFTKEFDGDWSIEDVFERFPDEWDWEFIQFTSDAVVTI